MEGRFGHNGGVAGSDAGRSGFVYGEEMSRGEFLRKVLGLGGVATVALVLAGCGGEDDDEEEDD